MLQKPGNFISIAQKHLWGLEFIPKNEISEHKIRIPFLYKYFLFSCSLKEENISHQQMQRLCWRTIVTVVGSLRYCRDRNPLKGGKEGTDKATQHKRTLAQQAGSLVLLAAEIRFHFHLQLFNLKFSFHGNSRETHYVGEIFWARYVSFYKSD